MSKTVAAVLWLSCLCATSAFALQDVQAGSFGELARVAPTRQEATHARVWQTVALNVTSLATPPASPAIISFTANPPTITAGQVSTLSWETREMTSVSISGIGSVPENGSVTVTPPVSTTYVMNATSKTGSASASTTVTVVPGGPRVVFASFPAGMVQVADQGGGADGFSVANIGNASTTIAVSQSGAFYQVSPLTLTLPAGGTGAIRITAFPQPAGSYEGSVTISGPGIEGPMTVPVRLLSSPPPSGSVLPQATQSRAEVSGAAGQPVSGSVSFTNTGSAAVQAIAVADVPWITPQSGLITIAAGQTVSVSYTIDPTKRPDANSPLGAVTGSISLVFLTGSSGPSLLADAPKTSSVSITVVYVVPPGTGAGDPQPLLAGQLALFIPGLANRPNATGDLLLINKALKSNVDDLKLFMLVPNSATALANIPRLSPAASALFPGLLNNIFHVRSGAGTVQVRASDMTKVSVAGLLTNTSSSRGSFGTQLPVFRSDRGAGAGARLLLSGVLKQQGMQTNVYLQEMSGVFSSATVDFLDARGRVISSRQQSLSPFAMNEMLDAVPSDAVAVRVSNVAGGRIGAYGLVVANDTGDAWLTTDPAADDSDVTAVIVPLILAGTGAETSLFLTNRTDAPVVANVNVHNASAKRRSVGRGKSGGTGLAPEIESAAATTLGPSETVKQPIDSVNAGYMRVDFPAGSVSVAGRSTRSGSFGTGLPAIPVRLGIGAGDIKRFAGIDASSAATRDARKPGTFRSGLLLIETDNASAVARVTLHYRFSAGAAISANATISKEYALGPSQSLMIEDLAADILGGERTSFGDLRGMDVDVEVVSGSGKIIPVIRSIDNGSEDVIVRTD